MADALIGADDTAYEAAGHEGRCRINPAYKRATWGLRPEDIAAQQEFMVQMQGRR